ncbi:hypothetical protein NQZ79_g6762 [Umbelopsis isabellina]|nr:hypothetical protein NQZ79_g6762 [Umbelopsis isabellina]
MDARSVLKFRDLAQTTLMFKKPSKAKAIRRKIETDDADEVEQGTEETVVQRTNLKKKKAGSAKKSLGLSFDEEQDGDGEVFQVQKSKASKRLGEQKKLHVPSLEPPEDMNQIDISAKTASPYSTEMLQQLRQSTPSTPKALVDAGLAQDDDALLMATKFPATLGARLGGASIPDANAIHAAKKKRELMRQGVTIKDDDYIPLDDQEAEGQSRLVREEDEDGDGDDEYEKYVGERLILGKKARRQQEDKRKAGVREMIEEAEEDDSELDEIDRWEQEMIKYGGVRAKKTDESESSEINRNYRPAPIPEQTAISSISDVLSRLSLVSSNLEESKVNHDKQLTQTLKDIENLKSSRELTDSELERTSKRYNYFQELKAYVNDLAEFLDAKFPELEKVEQQFNGLMNQRTKAVEQRRWQDDLDDIELFALVPNQFIDTQDDKEDELDEYGRAKSSRNSAASKRRRLEERSSRHILRETSDEITGMSTDDELGEAYAREEREELDEIQRDKINALIADVQDDFASLLAVKNKFETWKTDFNDDYSKAYGGLSLPGAFEFYVRIELITWNPFLRPVDFDTMRWHTIISEYGASGEHEDDADDSDATILNKVVEKTVCKKIKDMIPNLDVFSSAQMKSARHAFEQVSYYVEDTEPAYKELQSSTMEHFARIVTQYVDLVAAITLKDQLDDAAQKARSRLSKRMVKLYKNLLPWKRLLSPLDPQAQLYAPLYEKALSKVANPSDGELSSLLA